MVDNRIKAAQAGEKVAIRGPDGLTRREVKAPCEDKHGGHWYCVTHQEAFDNQFMKDTHISKGRHTLVWMCHAHGAEQP